MRMTTNANRRVTDEQIERARSIDLVQFLQQYEPPGELKRIGQSWTLNLMTVCVSQQMVDGTGSHRTRAAAMQIGFLQAVHGMSFQDAVRTLAGEDLSTIPATAGRAQSKAA